MSSNSRDEDWENRSGGAVADLIAHKYGRKPRAPFVEPGCPPDIGGMSGSIGRGGSNRRTRPSSPPRFLPRRIKTRR